MTAPAVAQENNRQRRSPAQIDRIILDQLARSNAPVSAYDLASRCRAAGVSIVPNQVYRTLARLMETRQVHRLETLSAYMIHDAEFDACLICDACHDVQLQAAPDTVAALRGHAAALGFRVTRTIIETHGRCALCGAS